MKALVYSGKKKKVLKRVAKKKKQNIPVLKLQSLHAEQNVLCYMPFSQLRLLGPYRDVQMSGQLTASLQQALNLPQPRTCENKWLIPFLSIQRIQS